MKGDRPTVEVGLEVDFAAKTAARAPKGLILLSPLGAGGGDVRANDRAVEHLHQMRCLAGLGQQLEKCLHHAGAAEPPEPFPNAVPQPERGRQRAPSQIMNREEMQRFQKLAVVPAWLTTARLPR